MRVPKRAGAVSGILRLIFVASLLAGVSGPLAGEIRAQGATSDLTIIHSTPAAGATGVPATGFISLSFDRPVVTLGDVGVAGAHVPATISPAVKGSGRWLNTSVWAYQLAGGLALATHYTVRTVPGLAAQDGARLAQPYTYAFDTLRPAVQSVAPTNGTRYALPRDLVQVVFNQPVRQGSAQGAFQLTANGRPVQGHFTWNDRLQATQPNGSGATTPAQGQDGGGPAGPAQPPARNTVMTFHPGAPLPPGAAIQVTEGSGVQGTGGPLPMAAPYTWQYAITGKLMVTSSNPATGATGVDASSNGVTILLSAPAAPNHVQGAVHVAPPLQYQYVSLDDTGTNLNVSGSFNPSTTYTVTIDRRLLGTAGQALAAPYSLQFTTAPAASSVSLVSQGAAAVYNAYLGANIYAQVVNLPTVAISLYRLRPDQFLQLLDNPPNGWNGTPPAGAPLLSSWYVPSSAKQNQTILVKQPLVVHGQAVPPGYYLVDAGPGEGGIGGHLLVLITRTSVTLKIGQHQAFVWATDLKTGKPVPGEQVRIVDSNGRVWATGTTNAQGIFEQTVTGLRSDDSLLQHGVQAQLTHGTDVATCDLNWNSGVGPWDFNLPFTAYLPPVRLYLTTERPIYRPGQPVYFKGMARHDNDGQYTLPAAGSPVQVQITDARGNTIYNARLKLDRFGAFNGKVLLSSGAAVGGYNLSASIGVSGTNAIFQVAEYKAPDYAVTVTTDRGQNANYTQGERVGVQVRARYYFGAPLGHAAVQWDLTQNDFTFSSPLFPDYDFTNIDYTAGQQQTSLGEQVTQGSGTTDSHGDFHFSVPANVSKFSQSQQFTLEAIVTGPDNSQVAQQTQAVVHKAGVYVGLKPAQYVATAGKPSQVQLVTVAEDGLHTVGGVPVRAKIYKRIWLSSFVRDSSGFYYWRDRHKDTLVATVTLHTNGQGRGTFQFVPRDGGEYRAVVTAKDQAGRPSTSSISLWVAGAGEAYVPWQPQNNDQIRLVADRPSYKPGETAHILVTAPLAGMTALVTVERGGVLWHELTVLPSNSSEIRVPIRGLYAPDVYVSVTLVKGPGQDTSLPDWKLGYLLLPVDTAARSLHVTITPSTTHASPRQRVTFKLHATDATGKGVVAQLAISIVDKAVLALAANNNLDLMDTFYASRDLGVESAGSLTLYIDRLNLNQQVGAKGGSGGGGGGVGPTRSQFPDTAYWNPSVVTDRNGNATVSVILPDNLTTWTVSALGGTSGTLVGQASTDIISSKNLLLEAALPRFLTVGDTTQSGAVVDNLTSKAQQVHVTLHVTGAGVATDYVSTVPVPAGGSQLVQWPIQAEGVGTQTYLFTARSLTDTNLGDSLQVSLPVEANSIPQEAITSGQVRTSVTETVQIPTNVTANQGALTVTVQPSLVAGLAAAAEFLANYPYSCAEQTTSRYYGLVAVTRLPPAVSGVSASLAANVPATVQTALQQLYTSQNSDGGWGWWPEDPSAPFMTAWVLDGLLMLRAQGGSVDRHVVSQAVSYLRGWAVSPSGGIPGYVDYIAGATPTLDLQAYITYLLGRAGTPDSGLAGLLYPQRQNMLPFARAYLALAMARTGGARDAQVHDLLAGIEGTVQQFDNQAHWSDPAPDWLMMDNDTAATATILDTLLTLDPRSPLIMASVRWLMARRVDGAWDDTRSTALALHALADYAAHAQAFSGSSAFSVQVNGSTVGSGTITDANRGVARTFVLPLSALKPGSTAKVTLQQRGGSAALAYTIGLQTYLPVTQVKPVDHGITITRRYEAVGSSHGQAGSQLRVVLTLTTPEDLYYLRIDDPLPAGAEPVDPTLSTTSILSGITAQTTIPAGTTNLAWYISHVELHDDRASLFADYLQAGVYQYSYEIHLTTAGSYHTLPAQAKEYYFPDVYGHSAGQIYRIAAQ